MLVLDEAKSLFNAQLSAGDLRDKIVIERGLRLRVLRRALAKFSEGFKRRICMILVDTDSSIMKFAPPTHLMTSCSLREPPNKKLFPPCILHFQDPMVCDYVDNTMQLSGKDLFNHILSRNGENFEDEFLYLGRPLWKVHFGQTQNLHSVIILAISKLCPTNDRLSIFASLACRVTLKVRPYSNSASDMIASNMATLVATNLSRDALYVTYLSEPIVAVAASQYLKNRQADVTEFISTLSKYEDVDVGHRGEYMVQLHIMNAIDILTSHQPHISVTVGAFLDTLLGNGWRDYLKLVDAVENGRISLTQFKFFDLIPSVQTLRLALIRGLGIVPKIGINAGFDMAIPVICADGILSAIFVEVRNRMYGDEFKKKFPITRKAVSTVMGTKWLSRAVTLFINLNRGKDGPVEYGVLSYRSFKVLTISKTSNLPSFPSNLKALLMNPVCFDEALLLITASLADVDVSSYNGPRGLLDLQFTGQLDDADKLPMKRPNVVAKENEKQKKTK